MAIMRDESPNGVGAQPVSEMPAASTSAKGRSFRQRMNAVAVAGAVLVLLKLVTSLATPAHHPAMPSYSGTPLPPGINLSGRDSPPNWGPIPNFPQAVRNPPATLQ